MCDENDLSALPKPNPHWQLTRRQFGAGTGAFALAACTGMASEEQDAPTASGLVENTVVIDTPDGDADAFFVHPASGRYPAVIFWPDIAGLREAKRIMARRLASEGYAVVVVNPYYRDVTGVQFADFPAFRANGGFEKVGPWRDKLSSEAVMRDAGALAGWLDGQEAVDTARGIGSQGYCMGGPFTVYSAASVPARVKAAASFHGGGLVRDDEQSPHRLLTGTPDTGYLFAIAQNDDEKAPGDKVALRQAAAAAGVAAEVEVYAGDHGWCVLDSPAYHKEAAERAWGRLLALYSANL